MSTYGCPQAPIWIRERVGQFHAIGFSGGSEVAALAARTVRNDGSSWWIQSGGQGLNSSVGTGTVSSVGTVVSGPNTRPESNFTTFVTAASIGAFGGYTLGVGSAGRGIHRPQFSAIVRVSVSLADMGFWIGLMSADPGNTDTPNVGIGFRFRPSNSRLVACASDAIASFTTQQIGDPLVVDRSYRVEGAVKEGKHVYRVHELDEVALRWVLKERVTIVTDTIDQEVSNNLIQVFRCHTTIASSKQISVGFMQGRRANVEVP